MADSDIVIVGAARTAVGAFSGAFANTTRCIGCGRWAEEKALAEAGGFIVVAISQVRSKLLKLKQQIMGKAPPIDPGLLRASRQSVNTT